MKDQSKEQSGNMYSLENVKNGGIQLIKFVGGGNAEGTTNEEVVDMLIDRIAKQNARLKCVENEVVLSCLKSAQEALQSRAQLRVDQALTGTESAHNSGSLELEDSGTKAESAEPELIDMELILTMGRATAEGVIERLEGQRRERSSMDAVPLPNSNGTREDYATYGGWVDRAKAHLDEALPTGQRERGAMGITLMLAGALGLAEWMEKKGYFLKEPIEVREDN